MALVLCAMVAALVVLKNGHRWEGVQAVAQRAFSSITSAVFILLAAGALIGTWNMSGTIPTLVPYGMQVLSPTWYYAATALIRGVIAMLGRRSGVGGPPPYGRHPRDATPVVLTAAHRGHADPITGAVSPTIVWPAVSIVVTWRRRLAHRRRVVLGRADA